LINQYHEIAFISQWLRQSFAECAPACGQILATTKSDSPRIPKMPEFAGKVGFASPATERKFSKRRAGIELVATLSLAIALIIAATAVSIGMARAQASGAVHHSDGASLALAIFLGLMLVGMGGLTAIAAHEHQPPRR
jgi:hypothetical protein